MGGVHKLVTASSGGAVGTVAGRSVGWAESDSSSESDGAAPDWPRIGPCGD